MDASGIPEPVGVIPAAGRARRVSPLPCSKELFPVGFQLPEDHPESGLRPKPVCCYLLEQLRAARVERAFVLLGQGKWDIPAYLGDGSDLGLRLGYLVIEDSPDTATTTDHAWPFVRNAVVAFGFPDIIAEPADVFTRLLARQTQTAAEVVLGLFFADQPHKMDMVDVDTDGRIRRIVVKPSQTDLRFAWINAVWTPKFTAFLRRFQLQRGSGKTHLTAPEIHIGDAIGAALDAGLHVDSVMFSEGRYIDIGTPEDLTRAVRMFADRSS